MRTGFCAFTMLVRLIQLRVPRITLLVRQWTTTLLVRLLHYGLGSIGVQGLADVLFLLHPPFRERTCKTSDYLLETIYFGAYEASWVLAERDGVHESYTRSPANNGECCRASSCRQTFVA